ncbi:hypothetical protein [Paenibacillus xylanexedens]|nr:hypothetical protein [Paenibacillus xylanexedens]
MLNESEKAYSPESQTDGDTNESQTRYIMKYHSKDPMLPPKSNINVSTIR